MIIILYITFIFFNLYFLLKKKENKFLLILTFFLFIF